MKIVINNCYGGISEEHAKLRTDPDFVKKVERGYKGNEKTEFMGHWLDVKLEELSVAVIPDEATDYLITDYDGVESLYFVLNGKIVQWNKHKQ